MSIAVPRPVNRRTASRLGGRTGPWARIQPVVVLLAVVLLVGMPLWIIVVTAGKTQAEANNPNLALPERWQLWQNIVDVWNHEQDIRGAVGAPGAVHLCDRRRDRLQRDCSGAAARRRTMASPVLGRAPVTHQREHLS